MSVDDEQLEAKIGQILYNGYITNRLKEEVLQRVAHRNSLTLFFSLGTDTTNPEVEVLLKCEIVRKNSHIEQVKAQLREEQNSGLKKYLFCVLSTSDKMKEEDKTIETNFEYMLSQSLSWWARYSGSRDTLNVDKWKIECTRAVNAESVEEARIRLQLVKMEASE